MKWIKNIKWLFNHPCTNLKDAVGDYVCDYCNNTDGLWVTKYSVICQKCQKKVYDTVLKRKDS